jgi:magnesium chelatase family protein
MLSRRLPTILPPLTQEEALTSSKIHSVCGLLPRNSGLLTMRPYRAPHHTISDVGLMGGGTNISPGEISLAHNGVLFLDELPEFSRRTLETLRQPLESGVVTISRASGSMDFPCDFMLVAAMNPCPCGYLGDPRHSCRCNHAAIDRYRRKISGPLLDRFDMIIEVPPVDPAGLLSKPDGESSADIRARVVAARERQQRRYAACGATCNARLTGKQLRQFCPLTPQQQNMLLQAVEQFGLSARAFDRILRVARTIADLAGREYPSDNDLFEAIQFRQYENHLRA